MAKAKRDLPDPRVQGQLPSGLTPDQASLRGRIGAHALHSRYDSKELTSKARQAFLDRFDKEVDPNGELPVGERRRRAEHARKAYFTKLALKSAEARRAKS